MPDTLKYFMWGYQPHFQGSAKFLAERLFRHLDSKIISNVFLVGFIDEPTEGWHDICLEPENPGVTLELFRGTKAETSRLINSDPRSDIWHTLKEAQISSDSFVAARSLSTAVKNAIDSEAGGKVTYCSLPVRVGKYEVLVVLQLNLDAVETHYKLSTEYVDWDNKRVATSLIEAVTFSFFEICRNELERRDPGKVFGSYGSNVNKALRDAANILCLRVSRVSHKFGSVDLFETLNGVASMFYEKEAGIGSILLAEKGHENLKVEIVLSEPIRLTSHRAIRRLVEVAANGSSILADGEFAYGFGQIVGRYDSSREDLFEIAFSGHHRWSVRHDGNTLMTVEFGKPQPLVTGLNEEELIDRIDRRITLNNASQNQLLEIVRTACKLGHGTQVVISQIAKDEAERLSPQATCIQPLQLNENLVQKLCAVDGAILVDPDGMCHAFGLILDGIVSSKGDRNRGSRYNSAIRYSDNRNDCVIVVVSDDGMIDIIPKLRPRLYRTQIEEHIQQLEELAMSGEQDEGLFNELMSVAIDIQFYLTPEQCRRVNESHDQIVSGRKMEMGRVYVRHNTPVKPSPELDESYFLD